MKIIYIGSSSSPLSIISLEMLIESKHNVCAVAFDDVLHGDFDVITAGSIQSLAISSSIPLIKIKKDYRNFVAQIRLYQPDIILVSCYARLLPASILSLALKGCFNVHPSLLPEFRGPNPVFWQFRKGVINFGITLHRMTPKFDKGNIVSQKIMNMPDGIHYHDANKLLAEMASELILSFLDDVQYECVNEVVQDDQHSSYQSYPAESDYAVSTSWPAKRIYNFINAYKGSGVTFLCDVNGKEYKLIDAYSYQEALYSEMEDNSICLENNIITFACENSYIRCELKL